MSPSAGNHPDHDAVLYDALRAAGVPPHRLDSGHLVGAADLMAKEGVDPADAYEHVVTQSTHDSGLADPELRDVYGLGVGGAAPPASVSLDEAPEQRDLKRWPVTQASMNEGRETGPSDSGPGIAQPQRTQPTAVPQNGTTEWSEFRPPMVLAAMDESERRRLFGEKPSLFPDVGGGGVSVGRSPPPLPPFTSGGRTAGVFQTPTLNIPLQSGYKGPASTMPLPSRGFDNMVRAHVEGHAAALMRQGELVRPHFTSIIPTSVPDA